MIKPIWAAVGGLALLGTAGGIGVLVATTGGEDEVTFQPQAALATVSICPIDPSTAPWPYAGPSPNGPRRTLGKISFLQPDPASGVQWTFEIDDPGGMFLLLQTARSEVAIDAETGAVSQETARIHAD